MFPFPSTVRPLACVIVLLACAAIAAPPPTPEIPTRPIALADVDAADLADGWSDVRTIDGVKCRLATAGGMRTLDIDAWWSARSLRPPMGKVYVFEIRYKDTPAAPVIVYSQSGLAKYWGPKEAHRIGGAADGKWKTAAVPVNADQLMRLPDKRAKTGLAFVTSADLPVASVTVRLARPGDEQRYNAETRAWVASAQAKARAATPIKALPLQMSIDDLPGLVVAYPWSWMRPLGQAGQPQTTAQIGAPVKIRMALNELQGGSFGVYANGADLTGVDYAVSPLKGPAGTLKADIIRRTAEYSIVKKKWHPQRLWPAYKVDIPTSRSHWFVLNVRTKRGVTRPGTYKGTITVTAKQGKAELPLVVEVLDVDLPTMDEAGLFMGGCVKGLVPLHDFDFARDYNQNGINLWVAGVRPGMKIVNDKLVLDFEYLDEWMIGAKKRGLVGVVWFMGGDPYGFPHTMTLVRELQLIDTRGEREPHTAAEWIKLQASEANRDKPMAAERELLGEWVRQVAAHAKAAGWPEIILTPFDEPPKWVQRGKKQGHENRPDIIGAGKWIKPYFEDMCAVIRQAAPGLRVYGSIHHTNRWKMQEGFVFIDDVDVFCTNAIHEDWTAGEKVRAAGHDFWQYSGLNDASPPDRVRYTFGFYYGTFDSRGSLAWAYNWGRGWLGGDMYAWHTPFDTIPGPGFEGLREGWDDRRVLEAYRKKFPSDAEATRLLAELRKVATSNLARGGKGVIKDFWSQTGTNRMDAWRDAMLKRLAQAK